MVPRKATFGAGRKYGFLVRTFVQEILVPPSFRIRARSGDSRTLLREGGSKKFARPSLG